MTLYLDASVLVALFVDEPSSPRVTAALLGERLVISDFAAAEFSSAIARRQRMADLTRDEAEAALKAFDEWSGEATEAQDVISGDIRSATTLVRRFDLRLRAPDAIHVAVAKRLRAVLFTLDLRLADDAAALGLTVKI